METISLFNTFFLGFGLGSGFMLCFLLPLLIKETKRNTPKKKNQSFETVDLEHGKEVITKAGSVRVKVISDRSTDEDARGGHDDNLVIKLALRGTLSKSENDDRRNDEAQCSGSGKENPRDGINSGKSALT